MKKEMIKISLVLLTLMLLVATATMAVHADWNGTSATTGGSGGVPATGGYAIHSSESLEKIVVGYRFSYATLSGSTWATQGKTGMDGERCIEVWRNTGNSLAAEHYSNASCYTMMPLVTKIDYANAWKGKSSTQFPSLTQLYKYSRSNSRLGMANESYFTTAYSDVNGCGYAYATAALPSTPAGMGNWIRTGKHLDRIAKELGIVNGESALAGNYMITCEPVYFTQFAGSYISATASQYAQLGGSIFQPNDQLVSGVYLRDVRACAGPAWNTSFDYNGTYFYYNNTVYGAPGKSGTTSGTYAFLRKYFNFHFPRALYTTEAASIYNSAKPWTDPSVGSVADAQIDNNLISVRTIMEQGYGVGIAYGSTPTVPKYLHRLYVRYENADGTFSGYSLASSGNYASGSTFPAWSRAADTTYQAASFAAYTTGSATKDNYVTVYRKTSYIDLNGWLDSASSGNISGFGTADIYVNGTCVANDVTDYYTAHRHGSTYEIKDIKSTTGHTYNGLYSGSLSGTLSGTVSTYLNYNTNYVVPYYDPNGGTVGNGYSINSNGIIQNSSNVPWFHVINYGTNSDPYNASTFGLTKPGYTFSGWKVYSTGAVLNQDTAYSATTYAYTWDSSKTAANYHNFESRLVAQWTPINYTLTINPNGGTYNGTTSNTIINGNVGGTQSISWPTRSGYKFAGWDLSGYGSISDTKSSSSDFSSGNHVNVYNNTGNGNVVHTRIADSTNPTGSGYSLQIQTKGTASPEHGGFYNGTNSAANQKFLHVFMAKIPVGYGVTNAQNNCGNGYTVEWLTGYRGTGEWEVYAYVTNCGSSGTFSSFGHVYLYGGTAPVTWYLGFSQIYNITDDYSTYTYGLGNGTLTARWIPTTQYSGYTANWLFGFTQSEGNNSSKACVHIGNKTFYTGYKNTAYTVDIGHGVTAPNGFYLRTSTFETSAISGTWTQYAMGTTVIQKAGDMAYQFNYYPSSYTITYDLDGGTNHASNPSSYNVLYPVTFYTPTKSGYAFAGWTINGVAVSGINVGKSNANFASWSNASNYTAIYNELASRTTGNLTVKANWVPNEFTLTVNPNGGTWNNTASNSTFSMTNGSTKTIANPTRTGYTFTGWSVSGGGSISGTTYTQGTSNCTLTAQWKIKSFTQTVYARYENADGSWGSYSVVYSQPHNYGTTFSGWSRAADSASTTSVTYQAASCAGYTVTGAQDSYVSIYRQTYYLDIVNGKLDGVNADGIAGWGTCDITVNGVKVADDCTDHYIKYRSGSTWSISDVKPATGKQFNGMVSVGTSGTIYTTVLGWMDFTTTPYTLTVDPNGGSYNGKTSASALSPSLYYQSGNWWDIGTSGTRTGYTLLGYYTAKSGGTKVFDADGKCVNGSGYWSNNLYQKTDSLTVYAQWQANTYTNTIGHWIFGFSQNEGENGPKNGILLNTTSFTSVYNSTFKMDASKAITIPNGYTLMNVFSSPDVTDDWATHNIGISVTQKAKDMYFEYNYNPITYSITYNLNDDGDGIGSVVAASNPSSYNVLYGVTFNNPTRVGYDFQGWFLNGNKITGINEGINNNGFASMTTDQVYAALASRTTGNKDLVAEWKARTDTKYVVQHYRMNTDGSSYSLYATENLKGASDATLTLASLAKNYNGWKYSFGQVSSKTVTSTTILPDGTRVINLYYDLQFDVELSEIVIKDNQGNIVTNLDRVAIDKTYSVWHTYKNNSVHNIAVNAYHNGNKITFANGSQTLNLAAGSSTTIKVNEFYAGTEGKFTLSGAVYRDGMTGSTEKYETNLSNNEKSLNYTVVVPLPWIELIAPNQAYRENTEVITSVWIHNDTNEVFDPSRGLVVRIRVYDNNNNALLLTMEQATVVPANETQLVYFKWKVPTINGLSSSGLTIKADIRYNLISAFSNEVVKNDYEYIFWNVHYTPDTNYEGKQPDHWTAPGTPTTQSDAASWSVWEYKGNTFTKVTYGIQASAGVMELTPDSKTAYKQNGQWYMKSGYGFFANGVGSTISQLGSYAMPNSNAYTSSQYNYLMFPEYSYGSGDDQIATLEKVGDTWQLYNFLSYGRKHFTPIWYPDGAYIVKTVQADIWTPMGALTVSGTTNRLQIAGDIYDDWYIG